jgi:opacity protein-like surface antigen
MHTPLAGAMMRRYLQALAVLAAVLLPATAHAQWPELRVVPRVGIMTPADWFYVEFKQFGVQPMEWTESAILRSRVLGIAAEAAFDDLGIWVRGELLRTVGAETSVTHAILIPASQAHPATVVRTHYRVPTQLSVGTIDVVLPLRLRLAGRIQPYVTGGVGAKHYGFDASAIAPYEDQIVLPRPGTVAAFNAGGGFTVGTPWLLLDLQVRDAMSYYWELLQHDVVFLAGFGIRVR